LDSDLDLLSAFDFSGAHSLEFKYCGVGSLLLKTLPNHLTNLSLEGFSMQGHFSLPNLTTLKLSNVNLGTKPLREYLEFPRLKVLHLFRIFARTADEKARIEELFDPSSVTAILDDTFFERTSTLEYLALGKLSIGPSFTKTLLSCVSIKELILEECPMVTFIPSFVESVGNERSLPHLKTLRIRDSWTYHSGMSYGNFIKESNIRRPSMNIFNDGPGSDPGLF
jgi:hypothetical protein